jgi:molybdate transport system substrate-binding protein
MIRMRPLPTLILTLLLATPAPAETITVAAAVSLRDALTDIAAKFGKDTSHDVRFVFGSSGQLMGQVRNGAPIDLFISAADKQVDDLLKENLVLEQTRRVVAGNTLVLIVPAGAKSAPTGFRDLADPRHKRLAIGDPRTVPAGDYAMQVLAALKVKDAVADRTVHGTNVRQVLSYVERGEASAGIVYLTDALESGDKVRVVERAKADLHTPIRYTAILVKATKHQPVTQQFLDCLRTAASQKVLEAKGFTPPAVEHTKTQAEHP